jgi:hypothetical protein
VPEFIDPVFAKNKPQTGSLNFGTVKYSTCVVNGFGFLPVLKYEVEGIAFSLNVEKANSRTNSISSHSFRDIINRAGFFTFQTLPFTHSLLRLRTNWDRDIIFINRAGFFTFQTLPSTRSL